jgi:hypothetical protein
VRKSRDDPVFHRIVQLNAELYDDNDRYSEEGRFKGHQLEALWHELAQTYGVDYRIALAATMDVMPPDHPVSQTDYGAILDDIKRVLNGPAPTPEEMEATKAGFQSALAQFQERLTSNPETAAIINQGLGFLETYKVLLDYYKRKEPEANLNMLFPALNKMMNG